MVESTGKKLTFQIFSQNQSFLENKFTFQPESRPRFSIFLEKYFLKPKNSFNSEIILEYEPDKSASSH